MRRSRWGKEKEEKERKSQRKERSRFGLEDDDAGKKEEEKGKKIRKRMEFLRCIGDGGKGMYEANIR